MSTYVDPPRPEEVFHSMSVFLFFLNQQFGTTLLAMLGFGYNSGFAPFGVLPGDVFRFPL